MTPVIPGDPGVPLRHVAVWLIGGLVGWAAGIGACMAAIGLVR